MEQTKFQDVNIFILIIVEILLLVLIYWKYYSEKKRREKLEYHFEDYGLGRMQSWKPYIIPIAFFVILLWELMNRFYRYLYF